MVNEDKKIKVLTNYKKLLETNKNKEIKKMRDLDNYKLILTESSEVLFTNLYFKMNKNNFFGFSPNTKNQRNDLEIFILNSSGNNHKMLDHFSDIADMDNKVFTFVCKRNSLDIQKINEIAAKSRNNPPVEILFVDSINEDGIGGMVSTIIMVVNSHFNILKNTTAAYLSTNLLGFDIKRAKIAPIADERMSLKNFELIQSEENTFDFFLPSKEVWKTKSIESYIYLKIRRTFIDIELANTTQEIMKLNQSIDLISDEIDEIKKVVSDEKIKNFSDEMSILQGE